MNILLRNDTETFYKSTGDKQLPENLTSYYRCTQHTLESGCPAFIRAVKYKNNKSKLIYCLFHNHNTDFDKVKLPFDIKNYFISKIKQKIDIEEIYNEIINDVGSKITKKTDMVTLGYLRYLKSRYADPLRYNIDDIKSLKNLLNTNKEKLKENYQDTFTFLQYPEYPNNDNTPFVFAFSSHRFAPSDGYVSHTIMADATYGTNQYNYSLIVYGYVSSNMNFLPFLYIITDSETEEICTLVLCKFLNFKKKEIKASHIMSDMSSIFFKSWCNTFTDTLRWLYCIWHVKKAVKKQMFNKIKDDK